MSAQAPKEKIPLELPRELPGILDLSQAKTGEEVQVAYYDYIWKSFIALNWPNLPIKVSADGEEIISGFRGKPDPNAHISSQRGSNPDGLALSVWETYKEPSEVFLKPALWADYPIWNSPRPRPPGTGPSGAVARRLLRYSENFAEYATDINQPYFFDDATGPLIDQNGNFVRYEVGMNESFFAYIKHFQYYDAGRQIADVRFTVQNPPKEPLKPLQPRPGFQRPPNGGEPYLTGTSFPEQGLVDVKAAWRVLEPGKDRPERYLHRKVVIDEDGTVELMGLVALHVLRFIHIQEIDPLTKKAFKVPGFVASTFEQVDNVKGDAKAHPPVPASFNDGSPPNAVEKLYGFDFSIPPLARKTLPKPRAPVSIYRVDSQALSKPIEDINTNYQASLKPSVFQYYQLIGTQNKHPGHTLNFALDPSVLDKNGHQGPITGIYTNSNNLVNSALESYTQHNFSCIQCHVRARPKGVPEKAFEQDYFKTLTFLLQAAQSRFDGGE